MCCLQQLVSARRLSTFTAIRHPGGRFPFRPVITLSGLQSIRFLPYKRNILTSEKMAEAEGGSAIFASYESEFKLLLTEIREKLEETGGGEGFDSQVNDFKAVERAIDEAHEIIESMEMEILNVSSNTRGKCSAQLRKYKQSLADVRKQLELRKEEATAAGREERTRLALFGNAAYTPESTAELEQRSRLLSGTDRLERSSQRLRETQRMAHETESIGAGVLRDLGQQREQIISSRNTLLEADGYVDKSMRTLKGMSRRLMTNKFLSTGVIAILLILICLVIWLKFR